MYEYTNCGWLATLSSQSLLDKLILNACGDVGLFTTKKFSFDPKKKKKKKKNSTNSYISKQKQNSYHTQFSIQPH
jgi:hypothetical protein